MSYQMAAYGNQPISMAPPGMPGAQMYYAGGYPPTFPQQQIPAPGLAICMYILCNESLTFYIMHNV